MKILAFYLPQFHQIKENDEWWGEGFTEWDNVRKSKPLYRGHEMPRVPLDEYYYDLSDPNAILWQTRIAKEYGVYGFVYYHYWSTQGMLLNKPAEVMLENEEIDFPFVFCWANHDWTRSWANKSKKILRKQEYGEEEEWQKHFDYCLQFFKDKRYLKIDNKPIFVIYDPTADVFEKMIPYWNNLAKENGLEGIYFVHQSNNKTTKIAQQYGSHFEGGIEYQPSRAINEVYTKSVLFKLKRVLAGISDIKALRNKWTLKTYNYDVLWQTILKEKPIDNNSFPGAFVDWDNTPRRSNRGEICLGVTPEKFEHYLTQQICRARDVYKTDYLFIFAWNEWGESGYIEPDTKNGYGMLKAIKNALIASDEMPIKSEKDPK